MEGASGGRRVRAGRSGASATRCVAAISGLSREPCSPLLEHLVSPDPVVAPDFDEAEVAHAGVGGGHVLDDVAAAGVAGLDGPAAEDVAAGAHRAAELLD